MPRRRQVVSSVATALSPAEPRVAGDGRKADLAFPGDGKPKGWLRPLVIYFNLPPYSQFG